MLNWIVYLSVFRPCRFCLCFGMVLLLISGFDFEFVLAPRYKILLLLCAFD